MNSLTMISLDRIKLTGLAPASNDCLVLLSRPERRRVFLHARFMRCVSTFMCALTLAMLSAGNSLGADYYVRVSGNDKFDGSSPKLAFATVGRAIASCKSKSDRIFIGAGRYTVNSVQPMADKNSSLTIIGDTQGGFTGDKGSVEVVGPVDNWSIYLYDGAFLSFSGITFLGGGKGNNYGAVAIRMSKGVQYTDCVFKNMYLGCYSITSPTTLSNCQFSDVSYIGLLHHEGNLEIEDCQFDNCLYSVHSTLASMTVNKCKFNSDASTWRIAIYSNQSSAEMKNLDIVGYNTGIQCDSAKRVTVDDCYIEGVTSWGVYAMGEVLRVSDVTVLAKDRQGYGVCLRDTNRGQSKVTNCTFKGLSAGILSYGEKCQYTKVRVEDCWYGYYSYLASSTVINDKQGLTLDNNYIGILVANDAKTPGRLELSRLNLTNNDYGVYSYNASFSAQDCNFSGNSRAVYVMSAPTATLVNCEFAKNNTRNTWSHWGARIESSQINLNNCQFEQNDWGLVLVNLSDQEPQLSQVTIKDNKDYGLLVYNGNFSVAKDSQVQISGSNYGLMTQNTNCTIRSWTAPTSSNYPIYVYQGSLAMDDTDINSGTYGVISYYTLASKITNCSFDSISYIAVYDALSKSTVVENCQFKELSNALYIHSATTGQVSKCTFNGLTGSAVIASNQTNLSIQSCVIDQCKNYGVYCPMTNAPADAISMNDLQISNCTYGMYLTGVPINDSNLQNVQLTKNYYALLLQYAPMTLTEKSSIQLVENTYALMNYWGEMNLDSVKLADNQIGLYGYFSPVTVTNSYLSSTNYGCILYAGVVKMENVSFEGGNYGIYYDPYTQDGCNFTANQLDIRSVSSVGIYSIGRDVPSQTTLSNVTIDGSAYGIYCTGGTLVTDQVTVNKPTVFGLYAYNATSQHERLRILDGTSWGIYGNLGEMLLTSTQVRGGHGVLLNTQTSRVASSLVSGTTYGVYTQFADGKYEVVNCTLTDIGYLGVYANLGSVSVANSIVQSRAYGLYAEKGRGSIASDYNIVQGTTRAYTNVTTGANDLDKQPVFVNAASHDYRLNSGSPAINAGKDLSHLVSTDLDGNSRGSFGGFEIGAYEYMNPSGSVRIVQWQETAQ